MNTALARTTQLNNHLSRTPKNSPSNMSSQETNNPEFELQKVFNVKGKVALVTGGGSGIGLMVFSTFETHATLV